MTPQQIDAMKLALEALEYLGTMHFQHTGEALYQETFTALEEVLKEHAMQEVQRLGQEIEQAPYSVQQAYAMAKVCLDLHKAIGCKWGDNVYLAIVRLKAAAQPPQRTWVGLTKNERLELYRQFENCFESDDCEYEKAIEAKLKEKNQ